MARALFDLIFGTGGCGGREGWVCRAHQAAAQFGVGVSTAINWVRRFRETGSVRAGQDRRATSRRRSRASTAAWLLATDPGEGLHLARAGWPSSPSAA